MKDTSYSKIVNQAKTIRPIRPGPGKLGAVVQLYANHFPVKFNTKAVLFHYDVSVTGASSADPNSAPESPSEDLSPHLDAELLKRLILEVEKQARWKGKVPWAYDGRKNVIVAAELGGDTSRTFTCVVSNESGRQQEFQVALQLASKPNLAELVDFLEYQQRHLQKGVSRGATPDAPVLPQDCIMALDHVLKHNAGMKSDWWVIGKSNNLIFPPQTSDSRSRSLGGGAEVWIGYCQSLRPVQRGMAVNIDMTTTAFITPGPLLDLLLQELRLNKQDLARPLQDRQRKQAKKVFKGMTMTVTHMKRKAFVCKDLGESATNYMFESENGKISVAQYFQQKYRKLQYPNLPCVLAGSVNRRIAIPLEVCMVKEGQRKSKLTALETAGIIKHAAIRPEDRMRAIQESMAKSKLATDPLIRAFGLEVSTEMMKIQARVLPTPVVCYANGKTMQPDAGAWNLVKTKLHDTFDLKEWAVVSLMDRQRAEQPRDGPDASLTSFLNDFKIVLNECGVNVGPPAARSYWDDRRQPISDIMRCAYDQIRSAHKSKPPQLIFVVLPDTPDKDQLYKEVKYESDVVLGVPTQCVVAKNAAIGCLPKRGRAQYCANVAMKVNVKLGGVNNVISAAPEVPFHTQPDAALSWLAANWENAPFMFLGADVTHSVIKAENARSIAAVVGSMNRSATRYATRILVQKSERDLEMISGLKEAVKELLLEFTRNTRGKKPERIVYYRDGVSEGQFDHVLSEELLMIKQACVEMGDPSAEYNPPITIIVVQKRHKTRFFAVNASETDRSGNILAGTVVDQEVTHPFEYDFFLCSHSGIQGTSKPAHYHVLVDENGFLPDVLQLLTYRFCYMYCRATRSTSLPPPVYYAHLAAFRGRMLLIDEDGSSDTASQASSAGNLPGSSVLMSDVHRDIKSKMFYI